VLSESIIRTTLDQCLGFFGYDSMQQITNRTQMDVFKGSSKYYKYRPQYPKEVIDLIVANLPDKKGDLLDIGAGPGTLAIPLSHYFNRVVAVEPSREMIDEGKILATERKAENIDWLCANGEDLSDTIGEFQAVTFGNSLHWMDYKRMLEFAYTILAPGGCVGITGVSTIWQNTPEVWQQKTIEIIKKYLGEERRTSSGSFPSVKTKDYPKILEEIGFENVRYEHLKFPKIKVASSEIAQEQHSYSYAAPELFGNNLKNFDDELKEELLKINPNDEFFEERTGTVITGQK
jgi:ubiquinone/menaquinone biosynthesis C-methylase UbiE